MNFCADSASIWQLVGYFLLVFKIVIPLLLIIFGMIDLGKAVISSDDKAVSKAAKSLLMRVIAGVCIFLVPTIVSLVFKMVGNFGDVRDQYDICATCISSPNNCISSPNNCISSPNNSNCTYYVK